MEARVKTVNCISDNLKLVFGLKESGKKMEKKNKFGEKVIICVHEEEGWCSFYISWRNRGKAREQISSTPYRTKLWSGRRCLKIAHGFTDTSLFVSKFTQVGDSMHWWSLYIVNIKCAQTNAIQDPTSLRICVYVCGCTRTTQYHTGGVLHDYLLYYFSFGLPPTYFSWSITGLRSTKSKETNPRAYDPIIWRTTLTVSNRLSTEAVERQRNAGKMGAVQQNRPRISSSSIQLVRLMWKEKKEDFRLKAIKRGEKLKKGEGAMLPPGRTGTARDLQPMHRS